MSPGRPSATATALGFRGDIATSLAFVFPLLLGYEVGLLFSEGVNGVDFLTVALQRVSGGDRATYLLLHLGLALVYLGVVLYLRSRRQLDLGAFLPMLLESAIYALTLGSVIVFVMVEVFGFSGMLSAAVRMPAELGRAGTVVVTSLGAGVHEELVFRVLLFAGGFALLVVLGVPRLTAGLVAVVVASVAFSLAHHVGPGGEELELSVFTYRLLAGMVFAAIFYFRSFAHAVYTHFLYDVYVLALRS